MQVLKLLLHKLRWTQCYDTHMFFTTSIHFLSSFILQRDNHMSPMQNLPTIYYHTKTHGSSTVIDMSLIFHQLVHDRKWHHKVICKGVDKALHFLSACFSTVLVSDTVFVFLLVINYCYLHRTCSHSVQLCVSSGVAAQSGQQHQIPHLTSQGEVNHIYAVITAENWTCIPLKYASLLTITIINLTTYLVWVHCLMVLHQSCPFYISRWKAKLIITSELSRKERKYQHTESN